MEMNVKGRSEEGYNIIEMMVVFEDKGDRIKIEKEGRESFKVRGNFERGIKEGRGNMVMKERDEMRKNGGKEI